MYGPCQAGSEVVLYAIKGGGHTWPGGPADDDLIFSGNVTHAVSATEVLWASFKQHTTAGRAVLALAPHLTNNLLGVFSSLVSLTNDNGFSSSND